MYGAQLNVQNHIGSRLELSDVGAVTHADLFHKNIKGCCLL